MTPTPFHDWWQTQLVPPDPTPAQLRAWCRRAWEAGHAAATERAAGEERARWLAVLAPFAAAARGVPDNWPGVCPLTWEGTPSGRGYRVTTLPGGADTSCPTIDQWRALLAAVRAAAPGEGR